MGMGRVLLWPAEFIQLYLGSAQLCFGVLSTLVEAKVCELLVLLMLGNHAGRLLRPFFRH